MPQMTKASSQTSMSSRDVGSSSKHMSSRSQNRITCGKWARCQLPTFVWWSWGHHGEVPWRDRWQIAPRAAISSRGDALQKIYRYICVLLATCSIPIPIYFLWRLLAIMVRFSWLCYVSHGHHFALEVDIEIHFLPWWLRSSCCCVFLALSRI